MKKASGKRLVMIGRGDMVVGKGFFSNLAKGISKVAKGVVKGAKGISSGITKVTGLAPSQIAMMTGNPVAAATLAASGNGRRRR